MDWMLSLVAGLRSLLRKQQVERELDEELDSFLESAAADNQKTGMPPEEARRVALAGMASRNAVKHRVWSSRWESVFESLLQDLRFGVRGLAATPGFTAVALLSLALGIGANTSIFTLLNAVMLRPLPVREPQQLVMFGAGKWRGSTNGLPNTSWQLFSYPFFRAFAEQTSSFANVTAFSSIQMGSHISVNGGALEHVHIDLVSGSYFRVFEIAPAMGRLITESDDRIAGAGPVAVASYGWFQRHFAGDPGAIGQPIHIEGHDYTLIGVAQPGFAGHSAGEPSDLWIPLAMEKEISPGWNGLSNHDFQSLYIIGRLKPGVSLAQATASTNLLFRQIIRGQYVGDRPSPQDESDIQHASIELTSASHGLPDLQHRFSAPLEILMAIVGLVLLIACANIANMLLVRGVARSREVAVRQALGATRRRIACQFLIESLLLAVAGASIGILLAWRGSRMLLALASQGPEAIPLDLTPDYHVLGFTVLVTILTALLFGLAPTLRAARVELTSALKDGRGSSSVATRGVLSRSLIVGQIALSLLLLVAAGLFLRSLRNLSRLDLGFDPHNVTVFSLDEYAASLPLDASLLRLHQQTEQSVQGLPGVQWASFSMFTFNEGEWSEKILMQGIPQTPENTEDVLNNVIGTQYLKVVGIPLVAGRDFTAQDTANSPHVAIVNETLAHRFFPNQLALGHRFCICDPVRDRGKPFDIEIVGVVRDAKYVGIGEQPSMAAYFPYTQHNQYFGNFSVRSTESLAALIPAVRRAIAEASPNIAVAQVTPLADQVQGSIATQRLIGMLSAFFAGLAVFLAAIGVYGLVSYAVARRTGEIGIRLALGAGTRAMLWLVLRESMMLVGLGLALGVPVALATVHSLAAFLKTQLFQVNALDPLAFVIAISVICLMTMFAALLPARRACKVDPMTALRCE